MSEGNYINEIIVFSAEKQRELFDVVSIVFSEELKCSNCFTLPEVGQRAGAAMREKGFEKANKATFLSAPDYFIVGYNKKNGAAISLIGYPQDPNFSTKPNADYVPTPKQNTVQLSTEQQKKLAEIFVQVFQDNNKNGKVLLPVVGSKAGKKISEAGFGRASLELFKNASEFFDYSQDNKGLIYVFLKEGCGVVMPLKKTSNKKASKKASSGIIKNNKCFEDIIFERLLKTYKTNEVSVSNILVFLRQNRIVLPHTISSFEELTETLIKKYGGIIRDNGEGTTQEQYIILRETLPIPQEIRNRVELIIAEFFLDQELIPNVDIGQALKNNGINFKEYNYADLTAFIRAFPEIFRIVPQPAANNRYQIYVRIISSFRKKYEEVDFNRNSRDEILQTQFEKTICEMFDAERYDEIITLPMLREAIKHTNCIMWESIVKAYLITTGMSPENTPNMSDWEKEIIDFENFAAKITDEYLDSFSISKNKKEEIVKYAVDYNNKTVNYSNLGLRFQALCGKECYLAGVIFNLGLIARIPSDRNYCFRLLILYYSRNDETKIWKLWDEYAANLLNPSSMTMIVGTLFNEGRYDLVLEISNHYNSIFCPLEVAELYKEYANILLGKSNNKIQSLELLDNRRSVELVVSYLEYAKKEGKYELYIEMVYNCIIAPTEFVSLSSIKDILEQHVQFLNNYYPTLIQKMRNKDKSSIIVLKQLISLGIMEPCEEWVQINDSLLSEYKEKVRNSTSEDRESILYEAIDLFPSESIFVNELVSIIKNTGSSTEGNLEGFIENLIESGNYDQVIMLYEHDPTLEIRDKTWFLRKLSYCYQCKNDSKKTIDIEIGIISSMLKEGKEIQDCLSQLVSILYEGFITRTLVSLDEEIALKVYRLFDHYKCLPTIAHKYWIAMMGLALCAKIIPLLSLLYCFSDTIIDESAFMSLCENEIQESSLGYKNRVGDLQRTFEYLLTQEPPALFFSVLGRAANVIRTKQDESIYSKFRDNNSEKVEPNTLIKLIISEYNKERAWRLLSEYAYKSKKIGLNFVANSVWFFRFKDTSYALSNCVNLLDHHIDNNLPRNLLWCSMLMWNTNLGKAVIGYKNAFINHIRKCNSFKNTDSEILDGWFDILRNNPKPEQVDLLIAIEIAKQSASFGKLYRMIFNECTVYKELISRDIASFIRFCATFVYSSDDNSFHDALIDMRELRNQIGSFCRSKNDRSALVWIDELIDKRNGYMPDDYFVEASMAVLSSYPDAPSNDIVSKWITPDSNHRLPNYDLLRNWINTFGNIRIVNSAEYAIRNYISKNDLSEDEEERLNFYKLRLFLAEKYIVFFNKLHPNTNDDYLRRCKTYYGLRIITNQSSQMPADFKSKMYKDLEYFKQLDTYLNYEAGVNAFASVINDNLLKERFIYCGITNYWDKVLEHYLYNLEDLVSNRDAIEDYFKVIDYRPIRRRLLQMYYYVSGGQLLKEKEEIVTDDILNNKDVKYYYSKINDGDLDVFNYLNSVKALVEVIQPSLIEILKFMDDASDLEEKIRVVHSVIFVLSNKDLKQFRTRVDNIERDDLCDYVIPALISIQYSKDLSSMLLQMSLNNDKYTYLMLDNKLLISAVGHYTAYLFKSILCVNNEDYLGASECLSLAGPKGNAFESLYEKIVGSIENKTALDASEDYENDVQKDITLPKFSFMKTLDPNGMGLNQLVTDFYTENLYDAKGKCTVASKILFLIEEGAAFNDAINLLFDWGFFEIDASFDIERKACYLFEMLDNIDRLKDVKAFKDRFVRSFLYILQEFDFSILLKRFNRIFECHKVLYQRFVPYDNCDCYAQALIMLREMYNLGKDNVNPNIAMKEVNDVKANILALHIKYPQNRFANKCIDYVERFVQLIFERGVFEVAILNVDKQYDGIIYYQVRNKGYELISNIVLTISIEGVQSSIEQVRISSIIPEGLRPNQVYAGEYAPGMMFDDGTEIGCSITVEYSVTDENGQEVNKNYIAVDPNTNGKLIVKSKDIEAYQKDGSAGYSEEPIKREEGFIGRKNQLNDILGKLLNGKNVLLFGTNGTGKSSILFNIRKVSLPKMYADPNQHLGQYYAADLKFDIDCTEKSVFEAIINSVCVSCATLFKVFIKRNGTEETQDILEMAADEWTKSSNRIFDENGNCLNTDVIRQYFVTLDEALSISNLDLYILIDQFERVISSKNINSRHMLFLRDLTCQRIRFIMAGSNYLLEEVSVDKIRNQQKNFWSDIFSRGFEKIKIGNMDQDDFHLLIEQKNALNNGSIHYLPEAIDYLWQFTKGHAFYSCLLGNRTLDIMSNRKVRRDVIYPSDIFIAIYQPGKYLPSEKSNKEKETAIKEQIFQDIIDNTPIKLVGKTIAKMQSAGERKVSYQKLRDYIEEHRPDILDDFADALAVLVARDFITYDEIDIQHQTNLSKPEDLRAAREYFFTSDLYLEHFATVYVPELSTKEREEIENKNQSIDDLVTDLRTRKFSAEDIGKVRDALKEFGTNGPTTVIHTDTLVGTNTGTVNSIGTQNVVNIQNMTNAFNQILSGISGDQLLASFASLPRLDQYYEEKAFPKLIERVESGDVDAEAELSKGSEQMISDYQTALIQQEDDEEFCVWKVLGIQKDQYDYLSEKISPSFMMDLFFAAKLESIFAIIDDDDSIQADKKDFSPVSIMYCKIVEKMLKRYHTEVYQKRLPKASTEQKYQKELVKFGELSNPKIKKRIKNMITLGAFLFPINPLFDHEDSYEALAKTESKRTMWKQHGAMLNDVTEIRNKSAHGVVGSIVNSTQLQNLKKELFECEGLLNIVILSE